RCTEGTEGGNLLRSFSVLGQGPPRSTEEGSGQGRGQKPASVPHVLVPLCSLSMLRPIFPVRSPGSGPLGTMVAFTSIIRPARRVGLAGPGAGRAPRHENGRMFRPFPTSILLQEGADCHACSCAGAPEEGFGAV